MNEPKQDPTIDELEAVVHEFHAAVERYEKQIKKLQTDLEDMTRLAMDYKDANNRLESQIRERMSSPLND
jgi:uncharacterized coiled-coil protein SlyX